MAPSQDPLADPHDLLHDLGEVGLIPEELLVGVVELDDRGTISFYSVQPR